MRFKEFVQEAETLADVSDPPAPSHAWGWHLLIDMSDVNKNMDSEDAIENFFGLLLKTTKMKALSPIMIKRVDNKEEGRGISAVQIITTSSIVFHGDDKNRCVYLDVFTCKPFDQKVVINLIKKYFQPKRFKSKMIYRDAGPPQK
jgi:S-adenosylmethionine decarboxylase